MKSSIRTKLCLLASIALLVAISTSPALAGINRWTPYGPGAGTVQALAVDPATPGTLYALTGSQLPYGNGQIYKSTDFGATWKWSSAGLPFLAYSAQSLALDPGHPGTLFTNIGPFIFKSTDAAATWQQVAAVLDANDSYASCNLGIADGSLFYTWGPHVMRSLNGGETWTSMFDISQEIKALVVNPLAPHAVYLGSAAGGGGMWVSTDNGATFTMKDGMEEVTAIAASLTGPPGLLYAASNGKLQASVDGGQLWTKRGDIPNPVYALAVDAVNPMMVFAAHAKGISVSRDGGVTFKDSRGFAPFAIGGSVKVLALAADPARPGELYAGTETLGVMKSTSAGRVWAAETQKGLEAGFLGLPLIHKAAPDNVFVLGDTGLFRSKNAGQTWEKTSTDAGRGFAIAGLALDPLSPDVLYAANVRSGIYRSADGGVTWGHIGMNAASAVLAADTRTLLGLGDGGILRTTDSGKTWKVAFANTAQRSIIRIFADPANAKTFYATSMLNPKASPVYTVFRSRDNGATWQSFASGASTVAVAPGRPSTLYAVVPGTTVNHLLSTKNGGKTWAEVGTVPAAFNEVVVDQLDAATLYASTRARGILRSTDGGKTWAAVSVSLARQNKAYLGALAAHPVTPHTFYVVTLTGGLFEAQFTE